MYSNTTKTTTTTNSSANIRSVFYCPQNPDYTWDINNTTLPWILVVILYIASPITIILNFLVVRAVKQTKELQKQSNILLSSLAVADLVVGAINMPLSATVDVLILRQVSFAHICLLDFLNVYLTYCVWLSSLYHLTAIAWERYVAIVKWIDYKAIVTRSRVKKLAVISWLASVFTTVPFLIIELAGVDPEIVEYVYIVWAVCGAVALIALVYFYVMVYLGVRKRKTSQFSQVTALVKAKLESKVAKTTALLTTAVICAFIPGIVFSILGQIFPSLRTNVTFRLWETLIQLNSLVNPILYCYRDRRFRNAVLEMLRMRKPQTTQPAVGIVRYVRRKNLFAAEEDVLELQNVDKPTCLQRAASCDLAVVSDPVHELSHKIKLKRSMSAPSFDNGISLLVGLQPKQPSSFLITTATINFESAGVQNKATKRRSSINLKLPNDVKSQSTANRIHKIYRSKSCMDSSISVRFSNSCSNAKDRIFKIRPKSAPSFGSANPIVLDEASTDSGFNAKLWGMWTLACPWGTLYLLSFD